METAQTTSVTVASALMLGQMLFDIARDYWLSKIYV